MSCPIPKKLCSGHTVEKLPQKDIDRIQKHFPIYGDLYRLQPGNWFFEQYAPHILDRVYNMEFRPTDVIALTCPKSGTTWSQEVVWTFLHNPNLDNPMATKLTTDFRAPHLEADFFVQQPKLPKLQQMDLIRSIIKQAAPDRLDDPDALFTHCDTMTSSNRVFKTHFSFSLMNPNLLEKCKVLYVARDPRDVIISRFSFFQLMKVHKFLGTFDEYFNYFLDEELWYNPYWPHLKEAWDRKDHPNMLFLCYEDMKVDPVKEYLKINEFLGTNLSREQVENIAEYNSFKTMKKRTEESEMGQPMSDGGNMQEEHVRKETGGFFRQGQSGGWKSKLTDDQIDRLNKWIKKNTKDYPKDFPYTKIE